MSCHDVYTFSPLVCWFFTCPVPLVLIYSIAFTFDRFSGLLFCCPYESLFVYTNLLASRKAEELNSV